MIEALLATIWALSSFILLSQMRKRFTETLWRVSYITTGTQKWAKVIYSFLFFPGGIVHELSHFFSATILGVRTGNIELLPVETKEGLKLGSVQVAKTDPLRRVIIGSAPLIIGVTALFLLLKILFPFIFTPSISNLTGNLISFDFSAVKLTLLYLLFTISNTMFISKKDREGFLPVSMVIVASAITWYLLPKSSIFEKRIFEILTEISFSLALTFTFVSILNGIIFFPLKVLVNFIEKKKTIKNIST